MKGEFSNRATIFCFEKVIHGVGNPLSRDSVTTHSPDVLYRNLLYVMILISSRVDSRSNQCKGGQLGDLHRESWLQSTSTPHLTY